MKQHWLLHVSCYQLGEEVSDIWHQNIHGNHKNEWTRNINCTKKIRTNVKKCEACEESRALCHLQIRKFKNKKKKVKFFIRPPTSHTYLSFVQHNCWPPKCGREKYKKHVSYKFIRPLNVRCKANRHSIIVLSILKKDSLEASTMNHFCNLKQVDISIKWLQNVSRKKEASLEFPLLTSARLHSCEMDAVL